MTFFLSRLLAVSVTFFLVVSTVIPVVFLTPLNVNKVLPPVAAL